MILGQSLIDIFKSSFVMLLLLASSIAAVALIVERLWYYYRNRFNTGRGLAELRRRLATGGADAALGWAKTQKNPMGRMFTVAMENIGLPTDELDDLMYSLILEEKLKFERLLGGMGTLANAATLLGLLGTVTGLITAFHSIAVTGSGGPAVVSKGIAEALITTAFGLFIGIPTLFFYNYFTKKSADLAVSLESAAERLSVMLSRMQAAGKIEAPRAQPQAQPAPAPKPVPAEDSSWKF